MFSFTSDFFTLVVVMFIKTLFLYIVTRYNSGNTEKRFNAKMTTNQTAHKKSAYTEQSVKKLLIFAGILGTSLRLTLHGVQSTLYPKFFSMTRTAIKWPHRHLAENETFYIVYVGGVVKKINYIVVNRSFFEDTKE